MREELFNNIREGIELQNGTKIHWDTLLTALIPKSESHNITDDYLTMSFGVVEIAKGLEIKLTATYSPFENKTLDYLKGSVKDENEALALVTQLKEYLGNPDSEEIGEWGVWVHWENERHKIGIRTRDHHGGSWFEYYIELKST